MHGVGWKILSQLVLQGSRIVVGVVLARLLSPADYGLAAMVIVLSGIVLVLSDLALGAALVQRPLVTERDRSTVFWTGAGVGLLFTVVAAGLSGPVASFYHKPEVRGLFAAFSLSFLLSSLATTQRALLIREMNFKRLELRLMAASLGGGVIGVAMAATGSGAWAIVVQQLAVGALSTALLWVASPWRPSFTFSFRSLRDLGGFSANVFGALLLFALRDNAGALWIGRALGAAALGVFQVASNVILMPLNRISVPLGEVMFPAFARMQDDPKRMAAAWFRMTRLVAAVTVPMLIGLIVVAPEFVVVVFGHRWHGVIPVIQILAGIGIFNALNSFSLNILVATDRTRTLFRYSVVFFAAHLAAYAVGIRWGVVGVAAAYAISSAAVEPVLIWLGARALGTTSWRFARNVAGVALASAAMGASVLVTRLALLEAGVPAAARLAILIAVGTAVYLPCCALCASEVVVDVRQIVGARRRSRSPAPVPESAIPIGGEAA
jgi:O-antigen/teichoic acid export membrane protein